VNFVVVINKDYGYDGKGEPFAAFGPFASKEIAELAGPEALKLMPESWVEYEYSVLELGVVP